MNQDDPFAEPSDTERTVIQPIPQAARPMAPPQQQPVPQQAPQQRAHSGAPMPGGTVAVEAALSGLNPLCAAAAPLFSLVGRIRNRAQHPNPEVLRQSVAREIKAFEQRALESQIPVQTLRIARYLVCATIDDVVLNTPWGEQSAWRQQSMVGTFHKETVGGDRVFDLLTRLEQEPARHKDLVEFLYVCLSLGFEGRLRIEERGSEKHFQLRDGLARVIRDQRGAIERDLSPRWKGINLPHRAIAAFAPIWMITALTVGLLLMIFLGFSFFLRGDVERVQGQLVSLISAAPVDFARKAPPPPPPPPPPPEVQAQTEFAEVRGFLDDEVAKNLVEVFENGNTVTVRIAGKAMFASASDQLSNQYQGLIDRIATALNDRPGRVLIAGHSDNIPIRTARFPNNTALSLARARSVMNRMAQTLNDAGRLSAEGRADKEPIASNTSAEGRAKNRRIEVILVKSS
ncbi:MAG: type IVB secretion system protein IcmH/DotU [Pseudomonadota bacterium]